MRPRLLLPALLLSPTLAIAQGRTGAGTAEAAGPPPTIAAKTATMKHMPGYLPLDWDAATGKLYLEIPHLATDMLFTDSLPWGTGSNDLGLDRGQTAEGKVVRFERTGPKVLLVEPNQAFRSSAADPAEVLAVKTSFPQSVLWGFTVAAQDADGAVLVDATDFFLRDVHHVIESLAAQNQGVFRIDPTRSTIDLDDTKAFPKNTEVEAQLTFVTEGGGGRGEGRGGGAHYVRDVTPDPHAMTLHERSSFVELPPLDAATGGFVPREFNPRAGYFPDSYRDYSVPLGDDMTQRFIIRHRLIKKDPTCKTACEAVTPIQYYVDRGAAEPARTALLEGARWWDTAFQAAGWAKGTFRVDFLPADADPMDVRYNIIQWVHRYTRGWSYGAAVTDPRTGEILKGNVTLGSLRGRQDYMIAEALLSPYTLGGPSVTASSSRVGNNPMLAMVLQRLRQLAAHETGHTLGLAHNFAASTYANNDHTQTMSVMEYPHPWITLNAKGEPDLTHAYPVSIGIWDKVSIDYGYRQFAPTANVHAELTKILTEADKRGLIFLTDEDARPFSSASPIDHLWDNGTNDADELDRILTIRAAALSRFSAAAIKPGTPLSELEKTLVPLYLLHRYQTEASIKAIGGLDYRYNLRGDGQMDPQIVAPALQQKALTAVLKTLTPDVLTLPESLLEILPPVPPGYERTQESFHSETGLTFDPIAAAESAADLTLTVLFDPARAARLVQYQAREPNAPSLLSVLEAVSATTAARPADPHALSAEVARAVEFRALEATLGLAVNPMTSSQARAVTHAHIDDLLKQATAAPALTDAAEAAHRAAMIARIQEFKANPDKFVPAKPLEAPPGMPIGDDEIM